MGCVPLPLLMAVLWRASLPAYEIILITNCTVGYVLLERERKKERKKEARMSVDIYWTDLQPSRLELPAATRVDCMSECRSHWIKESRSIQQHLLCVWPSGGMSRAELNDGTRTATRKTNVTTLGAHRGRSSSFQFVKFFFIFFYLSHRLYRPNHWPIVSCMNRFWSPYTAYY